MTYIPSLAAEAIEERKSWQFRIVAYTRGNQSQLGAFIVAMLGRKVAPPCFHVDGFKIKKDGQIVCLYKSSPNSPWRAETVWQSVDEFRDIFNGLADVVQMTDDERLAMFGELRKFIVKDERVVSQLH